MVLNGIETIGFMALGAERVTIRGQFSAMCVMTIIAGHPTLRHFTLQKRTQHEDFVINLTIGKVKSWIEKCNTVLVVKCSLRLDIPKR